jgi:hypothetical protein
MWLLKNLGIDANQLSPMPKKPRQVANQVEIMLNTDFNM